MIRKSDINLTVFERFYCGPAVIGHYWDIDHAVRTVRWDFSGELGGGFLYGLDLKTIEFLPE